MKQDRDYTLPRRATGGTGVGKVLFGLFLLATLLAGCAHWQEGPEPPREYRESDPQRVDQNERILLAEMARARGLSAQASAFYVEAAVHTASPELAERATRYAADAGRSEDALRSARAWVALDGQRSDAHWFLGLAELRSGHPEAAATAFVEALRDGDARDWSVLASELRREDRQWTAWQTARIMATSEELPGPALVAARMALQVRRMAEAELWAGRAMADPAQADLAGWLALRARNGRGDPMALAEGWDRLLGSGSNQAMLEMVTLLWEANQPGLAAALLRGQIERDGAGNSLEFAMALLEIELDQRESGVNRLERLARRGFRFQDSAYYLGVALEEENDPERAMRWYRRVSGGDELGSALAAYLDLAWQRGREVEVRIQLDSLQRGEPGIYREVARKLAGRHVEQGRIEEAGHLCRGLTASFPGDGESLYRCGLAMADAGRVDESLDYLRRAREAWPEEPRFMNALAYVLADEEVDLREARRLIRQALRDMPDSGALMDTRGWVEYRLGNTRRAQQWLERAWARQHHPVIAAHLGEVLWERGERERARRLLEGARERWPEDPDLQETWKRLLS